MQHATLQWQHYNGQSACADSHFGPDEPLRRRIEGRDLTWFVEVSVGLETQVLCKETVEEQ